ARQDLLVVTRYGFRTGVAVANANYIPLLVHFELVGDTGRPVTSTSLEIGASGHIAVYLDQLFPGLESMVGRLQFWAMHPLTSVALRFSPSGLTFTTLAPLAIGN